MKESKNKKTAWIFLVIALALGILSGCSTFDAGFDKAGKTQVMPGLEEEQPQNFTIKPEQLGEMGEPVGTYDVQNGEVVTDALFYTVNEVQLVDTPQEINLSPEELLLDGVSEELMDANGKLKESVKLLMVALTVQNVRAEPERNITSLDILCANGETEFYELYPASPVYFSCPSGKRTADGWKDYYKYRLPIGREKNVKVCWYVDTQCYDPKNLYLTFGFDELQKYIKLVF